MTALKCIAIDDDPLFVRKLEAFVEAIDWLQILESHNNPVKGATAIITESPDVVLLDMDMPYIDGEYLVDWIKPKLDLMESPPQIIIVSSIDRPEVSNMAHTIGYINKAQIKDSDSLESLLKGFLN